MKSEFFVQRGVIFLKNKMTEQDTLRPISDQTNLIPERKEDMSLSSTIFFLLKLLPIILALTTTVLKDSQTSTTICLLLAASVIIIDFIANRAYFGRKMIGISWHFSLSRENGSFYKYDILPEPEMPSGPDINAFWIGIAIPLIFWFVLPFIILASTNWLFFFLFFFLFILQAVNFFVFLKGDAIAAKQSAEAVRSVLLGNVDEFKELPEQATIESISKQNSSTSLTAQADAAGASNKTEDKQEAPQTHHENEDTTKTNDDAADGEKKEEV